MKKIVYSLLFIFEIFALNAQTTDTELWTDVNMGLRLSKKADLDFEVAHRRDNNMGNSKVSFFSPSFSYELTKKLDLGLGYRFSIMNGASNEQRLSMDLQYKFKIVKGLDFSYRLKVQNDWDNNGSKGAVVRNRIKLDYNLSKLVDPYVGFELFLDTGAPEFEQNRYIFGLDFNLPKGMDIAVYYIYRDKYNVANPATIHVLGISYGLGTIKTKKKGKKDED